MLLSRRGCTPLNCCVYKCKRTHTHTSFGAHHQNRSSTRSPEHHHHYRVWVAVAQTTHAHTRRKAASTRARFSRNNSGRVPAEWEFANAHTTVLTLLPVAVAVASVQYAPQLLCDADLGDRAQRAEAVWRFDGALGDSLELVFCVCVTCMFLHGYVTHSIQITSTLPWSLSHVHVSLSVCLLNNEQSTRLITAKTCQD